MTELLIDVGNSRCKYACIEDHCIKHHGAFVLSNLNEMSDIAQKCGSPTPDVSYMMSVASRSANASIVEAVAQNFGCMPILFDKDMLARKLARGAICGLSSRYQAAQLGIDRVAVMVAAWQRLRRACIVVDCGTAVTIDFIDGEGMHRGGVILPSDGLMRSRLSEGTAQLDYYNDADRHDVFATNTKEAIACGCKTALTAAVSAIVNEMCRQFNDNVAILLTGGGASLLENREKTIGGGEINFLSTRQLSVIPTLSFEGMLALIREYYHE